MNAFHAAITLVVLAPAFTASAASLLSQSRTIEAEAHFYIFPDHESHASDSESAEDFGDFGGIVEAIASESAWGIATQVSNVSANVVQASCTIEVGAFGNVTGISASAAAASTCDVGFELHHATVAELWATSHILLDEGSFGTNATVRVDGPAGEVFLMEANLQNHNVTFLETATLAAGSYTLSAIIQASVCGCPEGFYSEADLSLQLLLTSLCPGDVVGDGQVEFLDLDDLVVHWGACDECAQDLNGDGDVGFADLTSLLMTWGVCPEE